MQTNTQILTQQLPEIESSSFESPPSRYLKKKWVSLSIFLIIIYTGGLIGGYFIEWGYKYHVLLFCFISLPFFYLWSFKDFKHRSYALRENDLTYRKGWIFQKQTTIPFNRIQHTELATGPIDRFFNLTKLRIYTAGGATSDMRVTGLDPDEALKIKLFISKKANLHV
jgi:hypothetical protein